VVEKVRSEENNVLLLDTGRVFPRSGGLFKERADLHIKGMNMMQYSAMCVGKSEFQHGFDFLKEMQAAAEFPWITSNLIMRKTGVPLGSRYTILNVGEVKVGVVGVIAEHVFEKFKNPRISSRFSALSPEETLRKLIPEVRKKADIVILLSQCLFDTTLRLKKTIAGIDIVLCSPSAVVSKKELEADPRIFLVSQRGVSLGKVKITLAQDKTISNVLNTTVNLDDAVADQPQMAQLINDTFITISNQELEQRRKLSAERARKEAEKEVAKYKNMSPLEYFEMLKKQQGDPVKPGKNSTETMRKMRALENISGEDQ